MALSHFHTSHTNSYRRKGYRFINVVKLGEEIFDMGRDGGQASLNSKFAPDVFKYSLNYFVGDYQAVGFNQPFGNWINEPDISDDLEEPQLYNGNIRAMYIQSPNVKNALHFYEYDALNRISHSFSYEKAKVNRWFSNNNITKRYQTDYEYDGAGNLSHLTRKDQNASTFDNFTYHYITGTNKLEYISDLANSNLRTDDIDNQDLNNYSYDLNGRLVSDVHDGVTLIKWSKSDKVLEVHKPNGVLTIKYNALDQKISQSTSRNDSIVTEYFVYDQSGNVLASYGDTVFTTNGHHRFALHQLTIYGSSRIGLLEVDSLLWKDGSSNVVISNKYSQKLGLKRYELSNHLGNVSTVITDRKLVDSNSGGSITAYKADIVSVSDYYAFGMKIEERSWSSDSYRFGFNGKDFFSDWNILGFQARGYDTRTCRWLSIDSKTAKFPNVSPYVAFNNNPIIFVDPDGKIIQLFGSKEDNEQLVKALNKLTGQTFDIREEKNGKTYLILTKPVTAKDIEGNLAKNQLSAVLSSYVSGVNKTKQLNIYTINSTDKGFDEYETSIINVNGFDNIENVDLLNKVLHYVNEQDFKVKNPKKNPYGAAHIYAVLKGYIGTNPEKGETNEKYILDIASNFYEGKFQEEIIYGNDINSNLDDMSIYKVEDFEFYLNDTDKEGFQNIYLPKMKQSLRYGLTGEKPNQKQYYDTKEGNTIPEIRK